MLYAYIFVHIDLKINSLAKYKYFRATVKVKVLSSHEEKLNENKG